MAMRSVSRGVVLAVAMVLAAGGCGWMPKVSVPKIGLPRLWPKREPTAVSRYDAAKDLYEDGEYEKAVAAFERWLEDYAKTPLEPAALYYLARSRYRAGQTDQAAATYKLLQQEYKDTRWAAFAAEDLAHVQAPIPNLPDYERERRWWNPLEWLRPKLPVVRDFEAARDHFEDEEYNQAIVGFRTIAERNPKSPLAPASWYWVARSHEEMGQLDEATEVFNTVGSKYAGTEWEKHAREGLRRLKGRKATSE